MKKIFSLLVLVTLFVFYMPAVHAKASLTGCILNARIDSNSFAGERSVTVLIALPGSKQEIITLANPVTVNDRQYNSNTEAEELRELLKNSFVTCTLREEDRKIRSVTTATLLETYYEVKYAPEEGIFYYFDSDLAEEEMTEEDIEEDFWVPLPNTAGLPVFAYNGAHTAFLDENHYYEIEIYDTCVHIAGMYAICEDYFALPSLSAESSIEYHFNQTITISYDSAFVDRLSARLYDAENNLIQEETNSLISFSKLENKTADYSIRIYGVDNSNRQCTPEYTLHHQTKYISVSEGMVTGASLSPSISGYALNIYIQDVNGNENEYILPASPYHIAGRSYRDPEEAKEAAESLMHVYFIAEDGYLDIIEPVPQPNKTDAYSTTFYPQKNNSILEITFAEFPIDYIDYFFLVVAVYGENGELLSWYPKEFFPSTTECMCTCDELTIPENYKNCKVFLWKTKSCLSPFNG